MTLRAHVRVPRGIAAVLQVAHLASLFAGAGLVAWASYVSIDSAYTQWAGSRALAEPHESHDIIPRVPPSLVSRSSAPRGTVLGEFAIPRLGLSWVILEGTDTRTLDRSIGRVEGSAHLGEPGNIGIAGHRNTHFRKLEQVRRGDDIVLTSHNVAYRYVVEWVHVYRPDNLEVLDPSHGPALTLITCFPFQYIGSAPMRYVVRALPDNATSAKLMAVSLSVPVTR